MKNKIFSNQYNSLWCFLILFAHSPPSTTSYEEPWKVSILGFWKEYVKINIIYDYTIEDERLYWEHSSSCEEKKGGRRQVKRMEIMEHVGYHSLVDLDSLFVLLLSCLVPRMLAV